MRSFHRDGGMRVDGNHGAVPGYVPNSLSEWADSPQLAEPPLQLSGTAKHWDHRVDEDYYSQPGALFRLLSSEARQRLFDNTARFAHRNDRGNQTAACAQLLPGRSRIRR